MRIRTGHGPNDWTPNVPEAAHSAFNAFAVKAVTVSAMVPVLTYGDMPNTAAETARRKRSHETWKARQALLPKVAPTPRPICGAVLPWIGEPCARRPGHKWDHRSRGLLDANSADRRTGHRADE